MRSTKLQPWYTRLVALYRRIQEEVGFEGAEIITSGGFQAALECTELAELGVGVHNVAPDTSILHDMSSWPQYADAGFTPAALVCTRVASKPGDNVFAVDVGSKGIGTDGKGPVAGIVGSQQMKAYKCTEERLIFHVLDGKAPDSGSLQYLIPRSISGTTNLYDYALLVEGNEVSLGTCSRVLRAL